MKFFRFLKWFYVESTEDIFFRALKFGLTGLTIGSVIVPAFLIFINPGAILISITIGMSWMVFSIAVAAIMGIWDIIKETWNEFDERDDRNNRKIIAKLKGTYEAGEARDEDD